MNKITSNQLRRIMPFAKGRVDIFLESLNVAMEEFGIDTTVRQASFIAQLAHESGEFRYVRELASGKAYDTGRLAKRLGNTPEADGDGQKYKGRGLIQITGLSNYKQCSKALFGDEKMLVETPELLEQPLHACRSAAWYWKSRKLNDLADVGDFLGVTKKINGGTNGLEDRLKYWERARAFLGV